MTQNLITELPSELFTSSSILSLLFYGNPITVVPNVSSIPESFYWLDVRFRRSKLFSLGLMRPPLPIPFWLQEARPSAKKLWVLTLAP